MDSLEHESDGGISACDHAGPVSPWRNSAALRTGDAQRAEQLFIEALAEAPNNGWVLYGLSESYRAQDDRSGAKFAQDLFKDAWAGDRKAVTLAGL